jgi:hypothetical protein
MVEVEDRRDTEEVEVNKEMRKLELLMWNVRGLNGDHKQRYIKQLLTTQPVDVAMLCETRLNQSYQIFKYNSQQTMLGHKGGCATLA